ncbi:MAG: sulfurtransferase [Nocardioides sp.]
MSVLITTTELAAALESPNPPVVLDVRWRLTAAGGPPYDGRADYLAGHVPGAVFVDLDHDLASHPTDPAQGRHPLPTPEAFQDAVRTWGVSARDTVVVYDGEGNLAAARAWWLLRWAGAQDVRILDGALPAWIGAGRPLETDDVTPAPGTFSVTPGSMPTLDADGAGAWAADGILLDARAPERYRGETEPIDPKAGHIPGALNAPTGGNLTEDGRFKSPDDLRARFAALGVSPEAPVAAYCGSGVTAAHEVAALAIAGIDAALYPGSWSQWSNQDRPVATGA